MPLPRGGRPVRRDTDRRRSATSASTPSCSDADGTRWVGTAERPRPPPPRRSLRAARPRRATPETRSWRLPTTRTAACSSGWSAVCSAPAHRQRRLLVLRRGRERRRSRNGGSSSPAASRPRRRSPAGGDVCAPRRRRHVWIGTVAGLARYLARASAGPLAFRTQLEAFPDLWRAGSTPSSRTSAVSVGRPDRASSVSTAAISTSTAPGTAEWKQLGRADTLYGTGRTAPARRLALPRASARPGSDSTDELAVPNWVPFVGDPRTAEQPDVRSVAFTDGVIADLVDTWNPAGFATYGVDAAVDPRGSRCAEADGLPAGRPGRHARVPRLPVG